MGRKLIFERYIWFDAETRKGAYPNASKLAARFELSVKTAQRDITFMRDRLGCPLTYDDNKKGFYYEDGKFALPLTHLSEKEVLALLFARTLLRDFSSPSLENEISQVLSRMSNILQNSLPCADSIDDAVSIQVVGSTKTPTGVFSTALEGCLYKRQLHITYVSAYNNEETTRTVDPYHLLNYMGTWHLIAFCHERDDMRDFVLSRIANIKLLDKGFVMPRSFDIQDHLESSFGLFKGKPKYSVTLRFSPERSRRIKDQIWHKNQTTKLLKDGSLELTFPVASLYEVSMEILKHGSEVEVVKPKNLRALVKQEALRVARQY